MAMSWAKTMASWAGSRGKSHGIPWGVVGCHEIPREIPAAADDVPGGDLAASHVVSRVQVAGCTINSSIVTRPAV